MAIILDRPGFGAQLGTAFGGGLGKTLGSLAESKLQQMRQRQQAEQLKGSGLPEVLAYLDPQVQAQFLRGSQAAQIESQKEDIDASLNKRLSNLKQPPSDLQQPLSNLKQAPSDSQQFDTPSSPQSDAAVPDTPGTKDPNAASDKIENIEYADNITPKSVSQEARLKKEVEDLQAVIDDPDTPSRVRVNAEKRLLGKGKRFDKLTDQLYSATKETRNEVTKDLKENAELRATLEQQKELNERGELDTAGYLTFLKNAGWDIDALKSNDTQTFIKDNGIHFKNIKKLFGARPSEGEVRLYMKTIANEFQSPEGRRRIIDMMLIGADAADIRGQAMEDVIQDNGGLPPRDLGAQIERRSRKDVKAQYKKFKEIIRRPSLPGQNKFVTAVQAGAGSLIGGIPGALKGAGRGALLGYGASGGTPHGAMLGGLAGLTGLI